jgi:hypothetical protein
MVKNTFILTASFQTLKHEDALNSYNKSPNVVVQAAISPLAWTCTASFEQAKAQFITMLESLLT